MSAFMDTKKSLEVDIMSYVCVHLFKSTGCQLVSTGQYKQLTHKELCVCPFVQEHRLSTSKFWSI